MSKEYICKDLGHKSVYCHIIINLRWCKGCPYFEEQWAYRLKQSQNSYCIMYESKPMKDCEGARFNEKTGRYECECLKDDYGNLNKYSKCPYKTIREEFINKIK